MKVIVANRYSDLIQPQAREVRQLAMEISSSVPGFGQLTSPDQQMSAVLARFVGSFKFTDAKGRVPVAETIHSGSGNCLALSCVLASTLKAIAPTATNVVVFIGYRILQPTRLHAYVLTRGEKPGRLTIVDPQFMKALDYSLEGLWERFRIYVVFSEDREETRGIEIRAWLAQLASQGESPSVVEAVPVSQLAEGPASDGSHATPAVCDSPRGRFQWISYGASTPASNAILDCLRQPLAESVSGTSCSAAIRRKLEGAAEAFDRLDPLWRTKVAIVPENLARTLAQAAYQCSKIYLKTLVSEMPRIRELALCFRRGGRSCSWPDVAHIVVGGLVIDKGLRDELLHCGAIIRQPEDFWIWIFDGGTGARHRFGIRVRGDNQNGPALHELWHEGTRRTHPLKVDLADIVLLRSMSEQPGGVLNQAQQARALKLAFFGLCRKQGSYTANVPFLAGSEAALVRSEVTRICGNIVEASAREAMEKAARACAAELPGPVADIFKHAFARLLLEHAMDRVMEEKLIPPFPEVVDYSWGCWLTWSDDERRS